MGGRRRGGPKEGGEKAAEKRRRARGRGRAREEPEETRSRAGPAQPRRPRPGLLVAMAGLGPSSAVPVWLAEDDLGCIICQGLLDWPATLPCGHSFCRHCLEGLWGARGVRRWACPTCRQGAAQQPQLRKNTLLQDLADKYRRAAREIQAGSDPAPCTCPGSSPRSSPAPRPRRRPELQRVAVEKSITEVGQKLTELVEHLVDIVRSLQNQRPLSESGPDNELSILSKAFSSGVDLSMASPKLVTSDTAAGKIRDILHDLEEIQEKLQENVTRKEAPEAQMQGSLLPRLECSGTITAASISQAQENSWKPRLPPHAHCLTRATLHSGELLGLLSGPSIQPLT
nr:E3 ubiquitin-protein ligase RNF135 isoform X3 [Pongo abelii]